MNRVDPTQVSMSIGGHRVGLGACVGRHLQAWKTCDLTVFACYDDMAPADDDAALNPVLMLLPRLPGTSLGDRIDGASFDGDEYAPGERTVSLHVNHELFEVDGLPVTLYTVTDAERGEYCVRAYTTERDARTAFDALTSI